MTRALVLGGGGVTGIAWELGVIAGLAAEGIDVTDADLIVGTSAGATVAAQITAGVPIEDLVAIQEAEASSEIAVELDIDTLAEIFSVLADTSMPPDHRRARVGAMAIETDTVSEAVRLAVIEARLPRHEWPSHPVAIAVVDAHTGVFSVLDEGSGVPLLHAVAASCAVPGVWPPVTIGGSRYIDGGVRSATNVDLASGHDLALVLTPLHPTMTSRLEREVAGLEDEGALVLVLAADDDALVAMGPNPLDPAKRSPAVAAGRRQGMAFAASVRTHWR